ncbi:hypothetical protein PMW_180 [Pseudomonas phage phiPMW]|uniref:Uncharacterized protein n=1 Tax=Pseudomonas phage phiPMW TaxID=1815582 RepID=A0A1S5R1M2_9CAUD|nr:hypothetical protein FDG97_gp170 [Pseudomonas phage phiPMW]ANA49305.1 hypothetical protein PMW_180 [Pseudomonas phage phiPMW]
MFGLVGKVIKLQRLLKEAQDEIRELQATLDMANETTAQSVDNFSKLHASFTQQQQMIELLKRNQR